MTAFTDRLGSFRQWLESLGCEFRDPTNEYEIIRYVHPRDGVCVAYERKNGRITLPPTVDSHFRAFVKGVPTTARPILAEKRALIRALRERDGDDCFFCGEPLNNDVTLEHLLSVSDHGNNTLSNLALAHEACNRAAGSLSIVEKVKLRDRLVSEAAHRLREFPDHSQANEHRAAIGMAREG